ncbi:MAG TPA: DinB family protein [Thermoanaerobaculia bacterium]|nr:DinB family protein [Thermoanaerobaculia bacterium]
MKWDDVRRLHAEAAAELIATAERVERDAWTRPRSEGKWSPAEIVEHLNLAYDALLKDLAGGGGMRIRTKWWQRILLRYTLVPKLLRGGAFPANARAPRETRPATANADRDAAVQAFRDRSQQFETAAAAAIASGRRVKVTHAYFGRASLVEGVLLCTRHVQHHQKQLAGSA